MKIEKPLPENGVGDAGVVVAHADITSPNLETSIQIRRKG